MIQRIKVFWFAVPSICSLLYLKSLQVDAIFKHTDASKDRCRKNQMSVESLIQAGHSVDESMNANLFL